MSLRLPFLTLLLAALSSVTALADSPAKISEDYQKQSAAALAKLNETLEKATTPLIARLISSGDSAGAGLLTTQLKAKLAGEPVATPQDSATLLFAQYDQARAKALEPVQKDAFARIDSLLKTAGGTKLETVAELGKIRAEIEEGKIQSVSSLPVKWSFRRTPTGGETGVFTLNPDGTAQMKGGGSNSGKWKSQKQGKVITVVWTDPKDTWTVTFPDGYDLAEVQSLVWTDTRYLKALKEP